MSDTTAPVKRGRGRPAMPTIRELLADHDSVKVVSVCEMSDSVFWYNYDQCDLYNKYESIITAMVTHDVNRLDTKYDYQRFATLRFATTAESKMCVEFIQDMKRMEVKHKKTINLDTIVSAKLEQSRRIEKNLAQDKEEEERKKKDVIADLRDFDDESTSSIVTYVPTLADRQAIDNMNAAAQVKQLEDTCVKGFAELDELDDELAQVLKERRVIILVPNLLLDLVLM